MPFVFCTVTGERQVITLTVNRIYQSAIDGPIHKICIFLMQFTMGL